MPKGWLPRKEETSPSDKEIVAMKIALALAAVTAACLIPLAVRAVIRHFKEARAIFDILTEAEATGEHAHLIDLGDAEPPGTIVDQSHLTLVPTLLFFPDGFTCLRCYENPAMPAPAVWCAVCAPVVDQYPAEPIERGGLR